MSKLPDGTEALLETLSEQPVLVPDELTQHLMHKSGQDCKDPRLVRLVGLAAQRFIAEVIHDSLQLCKARLGTATKKQLREAGYKSTKRVLTSEDLSKALKEFGVKVGRPQYLVDAPGADGGSAAPAKS